MKICFYYGAKIAHVYFGAMTAHSKACDYLSEAIIIHLFRKIKVTEISKRAHHVEFVVQD